jgi:hypothetical protein
MRTNFPLVLAAIGMGFGMGDASADNNLDLKQLSAEPSGYAIQALDPGVRLDAGFSALSSGTPSSPVVSREALVCPEEVHALHSGFAAAASKDYASPNAVVGAPEMPRPNGFAALKPGGEGGVTALQGGVTALHGLPAREGVSQDLLQRPAGTQWSNGFQGLRQ